MKEVYKIICLALVLTATESRAQQVTERQQAEAAQRTLLKDSLGISDEQVTGVFALRENYFSKSGEVRRDTSLTLTQQSASLQQLKEATNNGIKALLGEVLFEKYSQMIRRRIKQPGKNPLAANN